MPIQTTLLLTCQHTCTACAGKGVLVPEGEYRGARCSDCDGLGTWTGKPVPLAEALRTDPATRAALRAVLAEVCGELAGSGFAPGVWLGAARVLGEEPPLPHEPRPPRRESGAPDRLGLREQGELEEKLREIAERGGLVVEEGGDG